MKTFILTLITSFCISYAWSQASPQQQLDAAVYEEEVNGDLDKALGMYGEIIRAFKNERGIVAEALYRSGLVNEKLGNKKAASYYENILKNFSDQSRQAEMAKKRLNTIYATMNTGKEAKGISVSRFHSESGMVFGRFSNDGRYLNYYENFNLYVKDIGTGKIVPLTTEGCSDSITRNADIGAWSYDDSKIAFDWHEGNDIWSLRIWDRASGKMNTVVPSGDFIWPMNWTRDGSKILVISGDDEGEMFTSILNLHDGSRDTLLSTQKGTWWAISEISPDGQYVIYKKESDRGDPDYFVLDVATRKSSLISGHSAPEESFYWTPDGTGIIFSSARSGDPAVYRWAFKDGSIVGDPQLVYEGLDDNTYIHLVTNQGEIILSSRHQEAGIFTADLKPETGVVSNRKEIRDHATELFNPRWSPDGKRLAMIQNGKQDQTGFLVVTDADGSVISKMDASFKPRTQLFYAPHWTYDGRIVVPDHRYEFAEFRDQPPTFLLFDPDAASSAPIANTMPEESWSAPVFISRDRYAVPIKSSDDLTNRIVKVNTGTGHTESLYKFPAGVFAGPFMSVSPDLKYLAFTTNTEEGEELRSLSFSIMDLKSGEVRKLFEPKKGIIAWAPPCWDRDGNFVRIKVLQEPDENGELEATIPIHAFNIQDGSMKVLPPADTGPDESIRWRKRQIAYDLHPDGDKIVFKQVKVTTNYWLLHYDRD